MNKLCVEDCIVKEFSIEPGMENHCVGKLAYGTPIVFNEAILFLVFGDSRAKFNVIVTATFSEGVGKKFRASITTYVGKVRDVPVLDGKGRQNEIDSINAGICSFISYPTNPKNVRIPVTENKVVSISRFT